MKEGPYIRKCLMLLVFLFGLGMEKGKERT